MSANSARLSLIFSSIGHFYIHMFTAFYAVVVLTLEDEWNMAYYDLLPLWLLGSILVGLGALPAGRLGDKWSARWMMAVFFLGLGGASILCGLVEGPTTMTLGLAGIGLFASIYHPVGIPWLIRNATSGTGKVLAINGIFGSLGTAGAGLIAGNLIALYGWRAAFVIPGIVCLLTGLVMVWCLVTDRITAAGPHRPKQAPQSRGDMLRAFIVLMIAMFVGAMIYNSLQNALPKLFSEQVQGLLGGGAQGAGNLFALVFALGGLMQVVGGHLADRYSLKTVYIVCWIGMMVFMMVVASAAGVGVLGAAAIAVMVNVASLPAENMMFARYTPERHHGVVFGIKFVLSFLAAPLAIKLIALVRQETGEFFWLFVGLGVAAVMVLAMLFALPSGRKAPVPAVAE